MNRLFFSRSLRPLLRPPPLVPRLFSSDPNPKPESKAESTSLSDPPPPPDPPIPHVGNAELKRRIDAYLVGCDDQALPSIFEAILSRKISGDHSETDEELVDELRFRPRDDVRDSEFESDFEEMHETDDEIKDLYNARDYAQKKLVQDEYFNMDDRKWDEMIREATEKGFLKGTKECEEILEDMMNFDKLLPGKNTEFVDIIG